MGSEGGSNDDRRCTILPGAWRTRGALLVMLLVIAAQGLMGNTHTPATDSIRNGRTGSAASPGTRYNAADTAALDSTRYDAADTAALDSTQYDAADTAALDSTQYESTDTTPYEQAALIGANVMLVPMAIAVTAISIVPPAAGLLLENGASYATLGFESGIGFGTQMQTGRFADERLMFSCIHVYNPHQPDIWRADAVKDFHCCFIGKRQLLLLGGSASAGLFVRGADRGYSLGASVHLMIPSLPFVGLFPLHTIGLSYKWNRSIAGGTFHSLALGISAAFIF